MQSLENFGATEEGILYFKNLLQFEKMKNFSLSGLGPTRLNSGPGRLQTDCAHARVRPKQRSHHHAVS
jgi:hypothetical protein